MRGLLNKLVVFLGLHNEGAEKFWFQEGVRYANAGAAAMTDNSPDKIIIGYHDALSKDALLKDLHKHFMNCARIAHQHPDYVEYISK